MTDDQRAIRNLAEAWMAASKAGDIETVLRLMADDVLFSVPGQEPFGKAPFAGNSRQMAGFEFDGSCDVQEIEVHGDWAWMRNRLRVSVTPPGGQPIVRSGCTLSILGKQADGRWLLVREANLLTAEA